MTELYFKLFNLMARNPKSRWLWLLAWVWRRVTALICLCKHLERRNWRQALVWLRMV